MYKLTNSTIILRSDGANIPADPENSDYKQYLNWLSQGNTPSPAELPSLSAESAVAYVQAKLDAFALSRNYDGIMSACTYATSKIARFRIEGQRCVDIRDATWANLYIYLGEIQKGTKPMPTSMSDIDKVLPPMTWI